MIRIIVASVPGGLVVAIWIGLISLATPLATIGLSTLPDGFWRGLADEAVARYLDCGIPEMGFARLRCDSCRRERLVTFSCRTRQLCPSCGAKRGVIFGAFLREQVVEPVAISPVPRGRRFAR